MLKATMKYSAVSAKVMALYGKLLTEDDWRHLSACAGTADIIAYLRGLKDWSETVTALVPSPPAAKLQAAVLKKIYAEYERIYKFARLEDKNYLLFVLYRAEYGYLLDTLRRLSARGVPAMSAETTDFVRRRSLVNIGALESCTDFQGLVEAAKGSIYELPLKSLQINPETGLPDYREAAVLLENHYYKSVYAYISEDYKGLGRRELKKVLGTEADLLNIVSFLRLQRYFPASLGRADNLMIPVYDLLEPRVLKNLLATKSEAEAIEVLNKTACRRYLEGRDLHRLDALYNEAMEAFCRKIVKSPVPSICTPTAYMTLRELECEKLNRLIQAVDYGIDPKEVI